MTVQADVHPLHIHEMMARLGIGPDAVVSPRSGLRYQTALHRCEACSAEKECKKRLDRAPAAITSAPWFCLNADILFELQYDQRGHAGSRKNRQVLLTLNTLRKRSMRR